MRSGACENPSNAQRRASVYITYEGGFDALRALTRVQDLITSITGSLATCYCRRPSLRLDNVLSFDRCCGLKLQFCSVTQRSLIITRIILGTIGRTTYWDEKFLRTWRCGDPVLTHVRRNCVPHWWLGDSIKFNM